MSRLKALKAGEMLKALIQAGFYVHHKTGSHAQLRHDRKTHLRVTVPCHAKFDLPISVVHSILKQAELSKEEFRKFL